MTTIQQPGHPEICFDATTIFSANVVATYWLSHDRRGFCYTGDCWWNGLTADYGGGDNFKASTVRYEYESIMMSASS